MNFENKDLGASSLKAQLIADFQIAESRMNGEAKTAIHQVRQEALKAFDQLGFPTTKHEEWKYSNVKSLVNESYEFNAGSAITLGDLEQLAIPNLEGNILYFINGIYNAELSNIVSSSSELQILTFADAVKQKSELVEKYFAKHSDFQNNAFTALNTAFAQNGVFVYVPENKLVETPVILRFITDTRTANTASQPRNLVVVGKRSQVKIAEAFRSFGENVAFTNSVTEIIVDEDANVDYYKVQNETDKSFHIGTTTVYQSNRSVFSANTVTANGGFVRNNLNIKSDGENCESNMFGLYIPNGRQHVDNHTSVDHIRPNSVSNELYKGILKDKSTGVFNGKIFVRQAAQKTNAFQSCKNVLASDEASMNTKPQLEIWADDVKCSHGTTTGQLNNDALFYMQSRGISKDSAKSLLMLAFAQEVIDKMQIPAIKEYLEGLIIEKIHNS
ncbi:Iron-regulated ABC transporter permease protein SufD [Pseudarcicella hirudinis]|uniref:Iron-regulated ABC transporter permease protein SufD n=1 Tax=Pseudarcicella hirudinis TaxID=1079859 RepID=A0A1I5PHW1_9BACT|nr:Fe-S cluster assembly protein SufD [Pseudarcicella hirudinis]SFP33712.1 Iron-regulated ABC transporter permease protein SufD [Pseudarcicella hirudinis]